MTYLGPCKKRYIDKYSYLSNNILGQGYSGVVYLGKHQQTANLCAIKIIEKSILKYQAHKSMILCEIQFLNMLKGSQNILNLYEVYNTKNNIYLVSELCNTDLKQYLTSRKIIPQPEAIDILKSIIIGYKAIWKAKIVHRDLKPSNILLKDSEVKIADFGFSMFQKDKKEYEKINVGSPYYMPLEVLGYNSYTYQSDIWALGIIFYQMLNGKTPWRAKTQKQLFQQIKNFNINQKINPILSEKSKEFLIKTLIVDSTKRMKPQELVNFNFDSFDEIGNIDLRNSIRSQEAHSLQKTIRKNRILHDPERNSKIQVNKNQQKNQDSDKNSNDEDQNEEIEIGLTNQQTQNILANSRMKKQNNEQNLDNVDELPSPSKKKKVVNRKTSLQVNYQPFQSQKNTDSPAVAQKYIINSNPEVPLKQNNEYKVEIKYMGKNINQKQAVKIDQKNPSQIEVMKRFSKVLRSQIHFCRYLFKLLQRLIENLPNQLNLVGPQLKQQMATLIFLKLKKIESQKLPKSQLMQEWLETKQWDKIKSVLKQYKAKYKMALEQLKIPKEFNKESFKKHLRKAILHIYKRAYEAYIAQEERQTKETKTKIKRTESERSTQMQEDDESAIMKIKEQIIILDYLITLKQLFRLQQKYGWQGFQKKAKIQSIVEGEPLKYIQQRHILAISQKLQLLKIL